MTWIFCRLGRWCSFDVMLASYATQKIFTAIYSTRNGYMAFRNGNCACHLLLRWRGDKDAISPVIRFAYFLCKCRGIFLQLLELCHQFQNNRLDSCLWIQWINFSTFAVLLKDHRSGDRVGGMPVNVPHHSRGCFLMQLFLPHKCWNDCVQVKLQIIIKPGKCPF